MKTSEAGILALELMKAHGLTDWTFRWDRAKLRFGMCNSSIKTISLSLPLTELNEESHVKETILHEIAHGLVGSRNQHNWIWKHAAIKIGAKPIRCYSADVIQGYANWVAECIFCHNKFKMFRKPKNSRSCNFCSRSYNPTFKLTWNPA